jgi:adenylate kinase family enzyme
MKNYLITGIAGTGKSTVGEALAEKGYRVMEFDGSPSDRVIFKQQYRRTFDKRTDQLSGFVRGSGWQELQHVEWRVDRHKLLPDIEGPEDQVQFICAYADNWREFRSDFDGIFLLEVGQPIIEQRLLNRTSGDWGRKHPEELKHAIETAAKFNYSLKQLGAITINAEAPVGEIVDQILKQIKSSD